MRLWLICTQKAHTTRNFGGDFCKISIFLTKFFLCAQWVHIMLSRNLKKMGYIYKYWFKKGFLFVGSLNIIFRYGKMTLSHFPKFRFPQNPVEIQSQIARKFEKWLFSSFMPDVRKYFFVSKPILFMHLGPNRSLNMSTTNLWWF